MSSSNEHERHGVARSSQWEKVEKSFLLRNPYCAACKHTQFHVQVHHVFPFHYCILLDRPDLELDPRNLISLCETTQYVRADNHHLLLGHCDDFRSANLQVRDSVKTFKGWNEVSMKHDAGFQKLKENKLKPWDEMTDEDKSNFKYLMNVTFPL